MKQRVLVMNGQRLLQTEQNGQWNVSKVERAGNLEPGLYNLYLADPADKAKEYVGLILHADKDYVYQQQPDDEVVRHARTDFGIAPEIGTLKSISYDEQNRAKVQAATLAHGRGMTR